MNYKISAYYTPKILERRVAQFVGVTDQMRLPDFFLVGAPKAGTTSIYNYLSEHPGVYTTPMKEPHFFACPEVKDTYYDVSFVDDLDEYAALFEDAGDTQKAGDFSPSYLYRTQAAHRIHRHCPDALILMILRDPVERAISHYLMDVRGGYNEESLMDCLTKEDDSLRRYYREYVEVGRYTTQVNEYKSVFGKDNMKILLFDDLKSSAEEMMIEIEKFLGIKKSKKINVNKKHNRHAKLESKIIDKINRSRVGKYLKMVMPERSKGVIGKYLFSESKPEFREERSMLREIFESEIQEMQNLINRDVSHWSS